MTHTPQSNLHSPQPDPRSVDLSGHNVYRGPSMNPTLMEPDILEVVPYDENQPVVGDIVVFPAPGTGVTVVHRVIEIDGDSVRTRGDNNPEPDEWSTPAADILGKVVAASRGQGRRELVNGAAGHALAKRLRVRRILMKIARFFFRPFYLALAWTGVCRLFVRGDRRPRILVFGETRRLMMGDRPIGKFNETRQAWDVRFPYLLFVDPELLRGDAEKQRRRLETGEGSVGKEREKEGQSDQSSVISDQSDLPAEPASEHEHEHEHEHDDDRTSESETPSSKALSDEVTAGRRRVHPPSAESTPLLRGSAVPADLDAKAEAWICATLARYWGAAEPRSKMQDSGSRMHGQDAHATSGEQSDHSASDSDSGSAMALSGGLAMQNASMSTAHGSVSDSGSSIPDPESRIPDPSSQFWDEVKKLAAQQKVVGQLYRQIAATPEIAPAEVGRWLGFEHSVCLSKLDHWTETVGNLLAALHDGDVPFLVTKGWWFIHHFFDGDFAQHPASDIDLLIHRKDVEQANRMLCALGYETATEVWPGFKFRYLHEEAYQLHFPKLTRFICEIHWEIGFDLPGFDHIDRKGLFDRAIDATIAGEPAKAPCPEDHFVYQCGHAILQHPNDRAQLQRYYDMALLAHGFDLDWSAVRERAQEWHLVVCLKRCVEEIEKRWPETIPTDELVACRALEPQPDEERFMARALAEGASPTTNRFSHVRNLPGLATKIRFMLEWLFPSPTYMRARYCNNGSVLGVPFAYVKRLWEGGRVLLRRAR